MKKRRNVWYEDFQKGENSEFVYERTKCRVKVKYHMDKIYIWEDYIVII